MEDLDILIGETLESIEFTVDTVGFRFGGHALTFDAWPIVADSEGISIGPGQPGYRDALCTLLDAEVSETTYSEGRELTIQFDNDAVLAVSLRDEDLSSPQAGTFSTSHGTYEF